MRIFFSGKWQDRDRKIEVRNPFDGSVVDTVPQATAADAAAAIAPAVEGAAGMRKLPGYDRFQILQKAAALMRQRLQELGRTISREEGKILAEGVFEASRAAETIEISGEEAKRLSGEVLPLDASVRRSAVMVSTSPL